MILKSLSTLFLIVATGLQANAQTPVAHYDMSIADNSIKEQVTNNAYAVQSKLSPFSVDAIDGQALRFDGYSNFVKGGVSASTFNSDQFRLSVLMAVESYPMMRVEDAEQVATYGLICGNLDETAQKGIALELSSQGDLRFRFGSVNGGVLSVVGSQKMPLGKWSLVTVVADKASNATKIYMDGTEIASGRMGRIGIKHGENDFYIGKSATELKSGPFHINAFCGLIDDIAVYNDVTAPAATDYAEMPDFAYPADRYEGNLWRPQFHAMPTGSWTNETHGMLFSDGRYHLFFQKNANGPYMARLHWGHLSSENLCQWTEEPIAIAPSESYDIKGCWSGCIYEENGTPIILYTAVDNAKAVIAKANTQNASLLDWQKQGIVINGRPAGLSDDFRDPYYFEANGNKYIIVGTGKNGIGACTLHKYANGTWTNDGAIFFQGTSAVDHGNFWEMPNVTDMGNGKWLFTCTPLGMGNGVRTLYWAGTISSDGKFTPDNATPQTLEMNGISRNGYGLLSPTIYQHMGKTLMMGIVPDKLPTQDNYNMGWAHNYSLPREISLNSNGQLDQKPFSGLSVLRTETTATINETLNGTKSLSPVSGHQIELLGEFTVGSSGNMGFNFLKSGDKQVSLTYSAGRGRLILDISKLTRTVNDQDTYNGYYSTSLPEKVAQGGTLKLHVFLDGSILDIFVNDRWAYSVRLFPTDANEIEAEVFSDTSVDAKVSAWTLDGSNPTGIENIVTVVETIGNNKCYDLQGRQLQGKPQHGLYIMNGHKYVAR